MPNGTKWKSEKVRGSECGAYMETSARIGKCERDGDRGVAEVGECDKI